RAGKAIDRGRGEYRGTTASAIGNVDGSRVGEVQVRRTRGDSNPEGVNILAGTVLCRNEHRIVLGGSRPGDADAESGDAAAACGEVHRARDPAGDACGSGAGEAYGSDEVIHGREMDSVSRAAAESDRDD